jgi:hypothetical protein
MRRLKRYIAREAFHALQPPRTTAKSLAATQTASGIEGDP